MAEKANLTSVNIERLQKEIGELRKELADVYLKRGRHQDSSYERRKLLVKQLDTSIAEAEEALSQLVKQKYALINQDKRSRDGDSEETSAIKSLKKEASIYFKEWKGFPCGHGCKDRSALPLVAIREYIMTALEDRRLVWVEAPPSSGKTSLAQILVQENDFFMYICTHDDDFTLDCNGKDRIAIDEAQRLSLNGRIAMRTALESSRIKIVCLGVRGVKTICPNSDGCDLCAKCDQFKCSIAKNTHDCNHRFINTASLSFGGIESSRRITVDTLVVDQCELMEYIKMTLEDTVNPRITDVRGVAEVIIKVCGGSVGYAITILKTAVQELKDRQMMLTVSWLEDFCSPGSLLKKLSNERIIELSHLSRDAVIGLGCFLCKQPCQYHVSKYLKKQGFIDADANIRSPLHQQLAVKALVKSKFTWELDTDPVLYVRLLGVLISTLLRFPDTTGQIEDLINDRITNVLQGEQLPIDFVPRDKQTKDAKPDFVFKSNLYENPKTIIVENLVWQSNETNLSNSKMEALDHYNRFKDGLYKKTVGYDKGIVVDFVLGDNITVFDILNEPLVDRLTTKFESASDEPDVRFFFISIPTSLDVTIHELKKNGPNWTIVQRD